MRRMLLPFLSAVVVLGIAGKVRAEDDAKAIIAKAIKAHGGEDVLTKFKAGQFKSKGKLHLGGAELDMNQEIVFMLPDKFKETAEVQAGGVKVTVITMANGDKFSIEQNGEAVKLTPAMKEAIKDGQQMLRISRLVPLLKDKSYELAPLGEAKVEGKATVGVRVSAKGHKDISMYFDKETSLLVKVEHRTVDAETGNEITEERIVLEYDKKNKDGEPIPKKELVKRDGKTFAVVEVTEGKYLESLDDSNFRK